MGKNLKAVALGVAIVGVIGINITQFATQSKYAALLIFVTY